MGSSALHLVAHNENVQAKRMVSLLLESGADTGIVGARAGGEGGEASGWGERGEGGGEVLIMENNIYKFST